jgi:hypothetical protein
MAPCEDAGTQRESGERWTGHETSDATRPAPFAGGAQAPPRLIIHHFFVGPGMPEMLQSRDE